MSKVKIGLALSGGGARGFCHIGVIKVLEQYGITPYAIAGTSMGAVVGGVYASGAKLEDIYKFTDEISMNKIADLNFFNMYRHSLLKGNKVRKILDDVTVAKNIEDCPIKFVSVSFDLNSGKEVDFTKGNLVDSIYASMAVPTLFRPLEKDGMRLIDGGVANNLPHQLLKKMGCDIIICVDATGKYDGNRYKKNAIGTLVNILNIFIRQQQSNLHNDENIVITPKLDGILNFAFNKEVAISAIEAGEKTTKRKIKEILNKIKEIEERKDV